MTSPATAKVWMRFSTLDKAMGSASRLQAKYGPQFAVVRDEMGYGPGFISPFAVVSNSAV